MAKFTRGGIFATVAASIALILVVGAVAYFCLDGGEATAKAGNKNYAVYKDDHTLGKADAPVVLIEYAAPSCPHCAAFDMKVLPLLKKDYIDTGKVQYVLRIFPISPADGAVALLARCQPKEKYFPYIDFMFRNQPQWDPEYGVETVGDAIKKLAAQWGIGPGKFDQCINDKDEPERLNRIAQDGQMRYDVRAVPTAVLNGKVLQPEDIGSYPALKAKIDALLAGK